jgi:hypothetical protein
MNVTFFKRHTHTLSLFLALAREIYRKICMMYGGVCKELILRNLHFWGRLYIHWNCVKWRCSVVFFLKNPKKLSQSKTREIFCFSDFAGVCVLKWTFNIFDIAFCVMSNEKYHNRTVIIHDSVM